MVTWLMRMHPTPPLVDGLLAFQITGSPILALVALTAPILHGRIAMPFKEH